MKSRSWPITCARDLHAILVATKKNDIRSIREVARVADVNQYTAHAVLSGAMVKNANAGLDNIIKLADALGLEVTLSERDL